MNASLPFVLQRHAFESIRPAAILEVLGQKGLAADMAFGMVMAPRRFDVVKVANGVVSACDGAATLLGSAYEIRFFGATTDAHWQRTGASTGRLFALSVSAVDGGVPVEHSDVLERTYRLWGSTEGLDVAGWSQLVSRRIRPIPVPVSAPRTGALELTATEYVRKCAHGNAAIVAERLTGLRPVASTDRDNGGEGEDGQ